MRILYTLFLLAVSVNAQAVIQQVLVGHPSAGGGGGSSVATLSAVHTKENNSDGVLAYPSNTTAGSLLIVAWISDASGQSASGCTDTQSNTWTLVRSTVNSNPLWQTQVFKAVNTAGGANTVTCTVTGSGGQMFLLEYLKNGGGAPDVVDDAGVIENVSTVGPVTTTLADALLLVASYVGDGSSNPCTGSPSGTFTVTESGSFNSVGYVQNATAGTANDYSGTSCGSTAFFSNHVMLAIQST